jgi:hypothetical protein
MSTALTPRTRFAARLEAAINSSLVSQADVAQALCDRNPHLMGLILDGTIRLPLNKVAPLARLLGLDPAELTREWLAAFAPRLLPSFEELIMPALSSAEMSWVRGLRRHLGMMPTFDDRWGDTLKMMVDDIEE